MPNGFGEKPVLKLMFGALIRAAERWRGLRSTEFELRQIAPSERNSTTNIRFQPRHWQPQPSPEFESVPNAWKGWRYPVHYTTLEDMGIDPTKVAFKPLSGPPDGARQRAFLSKMRTWRLGRFLSLKLSGASPPFLKSARMR